MKDTRTKSQIEGDEIVEALDQGSQKDQTMPCN